MTCKCMQGACNHGGGQHKCTAYRACMFCALQYGFVLVLPSAHDVKHLFMQLVLDLTQH